MNNGFLLLFIALLAASLSACTIEVKPNKVRYGVVKLDSTRGWAFPVDFERARDLRRAEMFSEAAYIYILLYDTKHDSVISESIAMAAEVKAIDSMQSVAYHFQQAIGKELMLDPEVRKRGEPIDQKQMKKRYKWSSDIMNELVTKGIR